MIKKTVEWDYDNEICHIKFWELRKNDKKRGGNTLNHLKHF